MFSGAHIVLKEEPEDEISFPINYLSNKIFYGLEKAFKTLDFDHLRFLDHFMEVVKKREKVKGTLKKVDIFRFETIKKMRFQGFLCNNIKGFFPETKFYLLPGGRIQESRTGNKVSYEQEQKIWDYLYKNPNRVGKEIEPTIYDYCAGKRITVIANETHYKVPIRYIKDLGNGYFKIKVLFNGAVIQLDTQLTEHELIEKVKAAR
jgi:hypothetical protein